MSAVSSSRTPSTASSSERSTSLATSAWAPTRRASAATRPARRGRPVGLSHGEQPGDHRHDEQHGDTGEQRPQPSVLAGLLACSSSVARVSARSRSALVSRNVCSVGVRSGLRLVAPVESLGEPYPAVQLAVGPAHRVPGVGGDREVAQDPLALDVVVEPAAQAGPRPGECLVGQLDRSVVARHQPGRDEQLDQPLVFAIGGEQCAGVPGCVPVRLRRWARPAATGGRAGCAAVRPAPARRSPRPTARPPR